MQTETPLRPGYNRKIRFCKDTLECYSRRKFRKECEPQGVQISGEVVARAQGGHSRQVEIGGQSYELLKPGAKNRLLYRVAGYLQTDQGDYVALVKSRVPLLLLLLLLLLAAAAAGWFLLARPQARQIDPLPPDPNLGVIEDDDSEKAESEEGGGSVTLTYSLDASLSLSTGEIEVYFLNPNASNHDAGLELYVLDGEEPVKIAESGLIPAGYGLTEMELLQDAVTLSQGSYEALFLVSFYDPDTGEKALVESTITDVTLEVMP